jgi:hypothetical protein
VELHHNLVQTLIGTHPLRMKHADAAHGRARERANRVNVCPVRPQVLVKRLHRWAVVRSA